MVEIVHLLPAKVLDEVAAYTQFRSSLREVEPGASGSSPLQCQLKFRIRQRPVTAWPHADSRDGIYRITEPEKQIAGVA
jgi:hypothetical protein